MAYGTEDYSRDQDPATLDWTFGETALMPQAPSASITQGNPDWSSKHQQSVDDWRKRQQALLAKNPDLKAAHEERYRNRVKPDKDAFDLYAAMTRHW